MSGKAKRQCPRRPAGINATSQETINEAAEDAQGEQEMLNDSKQSASDSESPAAATSLLVLVHENIKFRKLCCNTG